MEKNLEKMCRVCMADGSRNLFENVQNLSSNLNSKTPLQFSSSSSLSSSSLSSLSSASKTTTTNTQTPNIISSTLATAARMSTTDITTLVDSSTCLKGASSTKILQQPSTSTLLPPPPHPPSPQQQHQQHNYTNSTNSVSSFEKLLEKLRFVTMIKIDDCENLPPLICDMCIIQLNVAYNFKRRAVDTDTKLRQYAIENGIYISEISHRQNSTLPNDVINTSSSLNNNINTNVNVVNVGNNKNHTDNTKHNGHGNINHDNLIRNEIARPFSAVLPFLIKTEPLDYETLSDITIDPEVDESNHSFGGQLHHYRNSIQTPSSTSYITSDIGFNNQQQHQQQQSMVRLNDNHLLRTINTQYSDIEFINNYLPQQNHQHKTNHPIETIRSSSEITVQSKSKTNNNNNIGLIVASTKLNRKIVTPEVISCSSSSTTSSPPSSQQALLLNLKNDTIQVKPITQLTNFDNKKLISPIKLTHQQNECNEISVSSSLSGTLTSMAPLTPNKIINTSKTTQLNEKKLKKRNRKSEIDKLEGLSVKPKLSNDKQYFLVPRSGIVTEPASTLIIKTRLRNKKLINPMNRIRQRIKQEIIDESQAKGTKSTTQKNSNNRNKEINEKIISKSKNNNLNSINDRLKTNNNRKQNLNQLSSTDKLISINKNSRIINKLERHSNSQYRTQRNSSEIGKSNKIRK